MLDWLHTTHQLPSMDQNVTIATFPIEGDPMNSTRRGLKSNVNVTRGDALLTIPRRLMMSRATAFASEIGEVIHALDEILNDKWILSIHLLYEWFSKSSLFQPYLDTIPAPNREKTTNVLFWTEQDLNLLQCNSDLQCQVADRIRKEQKLTTTMYNEIQPLLTSFFPKDTFTYSNFAWAYGTVKARCFTINVTATYGTNFVQHNANENTKYKIKPGLLSILVPLGDLFNHHNSNPPLQHGAYEFNDELDALVVYADQTYKVNDELFISYGILTNPDLLMSYGFIMLDNAFETVGFRLTVDMSVGNKEQDKRDAPLVNTHLPMEEVRRGLYKSRGIWTKNDDTSLKNKIKIVETHIGLDGRTSTPFKEALRIRELSWCDLIKCSSQSSTPTMPGGPTKNDNKDRQTTLSESMPTLDKDLQQAVADAMKGMFPGSGEKDDDKNNKPSIDPTIPVLSAQEMADLKVVKATASTMDTSLPLKGSHEAQVCDVLLRGAEILLKAYPTSLENDLLWLGRAPRTKDHAQTTTPDNKQDEQDELDRDGWTTSTSSTATTALDALTPRAYQAMLLRIETKRILHSIVLENLHCLRKAHNMSYVANNRQLTKEPTLPLNADERTKEMELKRKTIHKQMSEHFTAENSEWDRAWRHWRRKIHLVWGGGNGPDPTERGALDEKIERVISVNAQRIADALNSEMIKQWNQKDMDEKIERVTSANAQRKTDATDVAPFSGDTIEEQQRKDMETFAERNGEL